MARSGWSAGVNKTALFTLKPTLVKSHHKKGSGNENFIATKVGARNGDWSHLNALHGERFASWRRCSLKSTTLRSTSIPACS